MAADDEAARMARAFVASLPPMDEVAKQQFQRIFERAEQAVRERDHRGVTLEHLLRAIIAEPVGAEILRGVGADIATLDRDLANIIELAARPGADTAESIAACDAVEKLAALEIRRRGAKNAVGDLLAACFSAPVAQAVVRLRKQGVNRVDVLRYIAHRITKGGRGVALPRARLVKGEVKSRSPGTSECDVILHNDDYTTREFVIDLLQSLFDKNAVDAAAIMMATHENQRSVIGRYEHAAAAKKIEKARRRAEKAGYPLLLSLEPISGASR